MPTIAVTPEAKGEPRVAVSPETVKKFAGLGCTIRIPMGTGLSSRFSDDAYFTAGAQVVGSPAEALQGADILLKVQRPAPEELTALAPHGFAAAIMSPYDDRPGLEAIVQTGRGLFAMELMPRITRAQSMDVLSSQANLAGYKAVIDAASLFEQALPKMTTAAGPVPGARVFVMGAGVAGLQAIATARRLGAVVSATDVRPATKEQVASLGAKFVAVEDDEFKQAQTAAGYAKPMSEAYQLKQAELIAEHIKGQDIVITTALIPGRAAPRLVSREMIDSMRPGSVIVDLAAERGGNCELSQPDKLLEYRGIRIYGPVNLARSVAVNASSLYAKNLYNFLETMFDKKTKQLAVNFEDEIVKGTLIARDGSIVHPSLKPKEA